MANPSHLELLVAGRDAFNEWRAEHPEEVLDLRDADLSTYRDLRDFHIAPADMTGVVARQVEFSRSRLALVTMDDAQFYECSFDHCAMMESTAQRPVFEHCTFERAVLNGASWTDAQLRAIQFRRSSLSSCRWTGVEAVGCRFNRAVLNKMEIMHSTLFDTEINDCPRVDELRLGSTRLSRARIQASDFGRAKFVGVTMRRAQVESVKFTGASLSDVQMDGAHLSNVTFAGASLEVVGFVSAKLRKVDFRQSSLVEVGLDHASLDQCVIIDSVTCSQVHGFEATLKSCRIRNAVLLDCNLAGAVIERCQLELIVMLNCELFKSVWHGTTLWQCDLGFEEDKGSGVRLVEADLRAAEFRVCRLRRCDCKLALVDAETVFWDCHAEVHADFRGVPLRQARIEGKLLAFLERNCRQHYWSGWYTRHMARAVPYALFWALSDYGYRATRIFWTLVWVSVFFAALYMAPIIERDSYGVETTPLIENLDLSIPNSPDTSPLYVERDVPYYAHTAARALYFSIVTTTTLGFGDMHAHPNSPVGYALVSLQVLFGYLLLGCLVTRLAILFQSAG